MASQAEIVDVHPISSEPVERDITTSVTSVPGEKAIVAKSLLTVEKDNRPKSIRALDYYDIMILGLTGQGKTTTADKLLIANPEGIDYESRYPEPDDQNPRVEKQELFMQDLLLWCIPKGEDALKRISTRLKNLAYFRFFADPHKEVNRSNESTMHVNKRTRSCELLSNESTRVRVLDVPGFLSAVKVVDQQISGITTNAMASHLGTMRNILKIQAAMAMKFKCILYLLPCRDTLQISNAALQQELQIMEYYFGKSIFKKMVLVATLGPTTYKVLPENIPLRIPDEELEISRSTFHEALKSFIPELRDNQLSNVDEPKIDQPKPEGTPNPPIIFISMRDTCESILEKIQEAEVNGDDGLQLQLSSTVCALCSMTIGERKRERVAVTSDKDWSQAILYEDSYCHPFFVPKYTTRQKIAYAVRSFKEERPDFNEEKCHNCACPPGTQGCLQVGSKYSVGKKTLIVDHTSAVDDCASNHLLLLQDTPFEAETPNKEKQEVPFASPRAHSDSEKVESSGSDDSFISRRKVFSDTAVYDQRKKGKAEAGARRFFEAAGKDSTFTVERRVHSEVEVHNEKVQVDIEENTSEDATQLSDSDEPENEKTVS